MLLESQKIPELADPGLRLASIVPVTGEIKYPSSAQLFREMVTAGVGTGGGFD